MAKLTDLRDCLRDTCSRSCLVEIMLHKQGVCYWAIPTGTTHGATLNKMGAWFTFHVPRQMVSKWSDYWYVDEAVGMAECTSLRY